MIFMLLYSSNWALDMGSDLSFLVIDLCLEFSFRKKATQTAENTKVPSSPSTALKYQNRDQGFPWISPI